MKRLLDAAGSLLGLLVLAVLGIGLVMLLQAQRTANTVLPSATPGALLAMQSPLKTPTPAPTATRRLVSPTQTLPPTSTRPPAPPSATPWPTFTPAPSTATPEPLPTLIPGSQTFIYATTGEREPELDRFQVDNAVRKIGVVYKIDARAWPTSRVRVEGLYPSPDGKRVAVAWVYGEGGNSISILDVNSGRLTPLFGEEAKVDQRVFFLDWSPDGSSILVLGRDTNPDLRGSAWLVNMNTRQFRAMNIKQMTDAQQITGASFSPDGKTIVYARSECYKCGSEVWRVASDGSDQQLLFKVPQLMVGHVMWSPNGRYIAFTQWLESEEQEFFIGGIYSSAAVGELWVMDTQGGGRHELGSVLTGYYKQFGLAWSRDGVQVAFVLNDAPKLGTRLDELHSNIYVADVRSGDVRQLTQFSRVPILAPTWSPDGSVLAFVGNPDGVPGQLELWAVQADGQALHRIDEGHGLTVNTNAVNVSLVWLPATMLA